MSDVPARGSMWTLRKYLDEPERFWCLVVCQDLVHVCCLVWDATRPAGDEFEMRFLMPRSFGDLVFIGP